MRDEGQRGRFTPGKLERLRPPDRHADRNSDAEYALYRLPGRFQRFADECLFATERILAFVPWTAATEESWLHRFGRWFALGGREARAGAVLLTERAILFLEDDAEIAGGALAWGYTCLATSYERLAGIEVRRSADRCELDLILRAEGSAAVIHRAFPVSIAGQIEGLAARLGGFLADDNQRRLRVPGQIRPWEAITVAPGAEPLRGRRRPTTDQRMPDEDMQALAARCCAAVPPDHPVGRALARHHHALALVTSGAGSGESLAIVTREHVVVLPTEGTAAPRLLPLPSVTAVSLRRSVIATSITCTADESRSEAGSQTTLSLPAARAAASLPVFAALRQALTLLPHEAREPDQDRPTR